MTSRLLAVESTLLHKQKSCLTAADLTRSLLSGHLCSACSQTSLLCLANEECVAADARAPARVPPLSYGVPSPSLPAQSAPEVYAAHAFNWSEAQKKKSGLPPESEDSAPAGQLIGSGPSRPPLSSQIVLQSQPTEYNHVGGHDLQVGVCPTISEAVFS